MHKSRLHWCVRKQTWPRATSIDPMCIEESEEDEIEKHHLVEAWKVQKDTREDNVVYARKTTIHKSVVKCTTSHRCADNGKSTIVNHTNITMCGSLVI